VNNSGNQSVTWSVTGGGSIDSSGLYTAPASVPRCCDRAGGQCGIALGNRLGKRHCDQSWCPSA
jgi:hypothetical protein